MNKKKEKTLKKASASIVISNLKYFYKEAFHYQPSYFIFVTIAILVTAFSPFIDIILPKYIIEELMGEKRISRIAIIVLMITVGNLICNNIRSFAFVTLEKYTDRFERYFKVKISDKTMQMDFQSTEDPEVLEQAGRAENGMAWYSGGIAGLSECFMNIASGVLTLIGVTAVLFFNSPILLIVIAVSVVIRAFINGKVNAITVRYFKDAVSIDRGFGYIFWHLSNFRFGKDIRLYGATEMMLKKANWYNDRQSKRWKDQMMDQMPLSEIDVFIGVIGDGIKYFYLGYQAIKKFISIGDLTMLISASGSFDGSLRSVITNVQDIYRKSTFMQEYTKFVRLESSLSSGTKPVPKTEDYQFDFVNVSFKYPRAESYVLQGVNLTISSKEHLSVVGLNGAGKTTMVKLLCRLYDVTEGEIRLNGINIKEYDYSQYLSLFSVVFQDFKLFAFPMKENIILEDEVADDVEIYSGRKKQKSKTTMKSDCQEASVRLSACSIADDEILELCKISGLEEKVNALPKGLNTHLYREFKEDGVELSGGEAQKLAIARALYKNAPIVILDEPTAALDPMAEYEIYNQFDRLVGNKTAVYISHRLSSCKFCDRIAVFAKETVAEYGTHEELMKLQGGIYAEMFAAQAQYYVEKAV